MIRIADNIMWIAVGNRWLQLSLGADPVATHWLDPELTQTGEQGRFLAAGPVRRPESGNLEIWTCCEDGEIQVWAISPDEDAAGSRGLHLLGKIMTDSWPPTGGQPISLIHANSAEVWVGTSGGVVMAINVRSRQLTRVPLPPDHPAIHRRPIHCLAKKPGLLHSESQVIWSATADNALHRFQIDQPARASVSP
jgi:hypothetical protein